MDPKRTEAQAEASRRNGRLSAGPASPHGKLKVSANGVVHGLRSERVVLAHEDPAAYTEHVQLWIDTLKPVDEAELEVVVSIADCRWRLKRLDQVEMNRHRAEVLAQVEETPEHAFLKSIEDVLMATKFMTDVLAVPREYDADTLETLVGLVRRVIAMLHAVEAERVGLHLGTQQLNDATAYLTILSSRGEIDLAALDDLKKAASESVTATEAQVPAARAALESIKEKVAGTVPLPDGKQQSLVNRYRRDVERRLASEMAFLTAVRERKVQAESTSGLLGQPIPVSIRLVS